ncbi:hypothetical protein M378DRAFT_154690 [Amanita muscaria Koide BX008]|uniref:Uncharacterized protein n=1 Tax=Amanita muscaria (strain Koide BX008) TaxID=946122 RepID=A0A0C2TV51_AMAMK|nr:hypothetical protein M378DRAFT_154690 [Amanita muscaria Koide BX008]
MRTSEHATALADTHGSHPRHQPDVRNASRTSRTQSPYPVAIAQPTISSFATQFQGAQNFSISGHPTFTNIGVNNGVNNVNTVNNHGPVHVDNRDRQHYEINVETQYGNTNIGDGQHNGGGTYNFKDIP